MVPTLEPALTIDISALGSLYLSAVAPEALRAASRIVQHQADEVDTLSSVQHQPSPIQLDPGSERRGTAWTPLHDWLRRSAELKTCSTTSNTPLSGAFATVVGASAIIVTQIESAATASSAKPCALDTAEATRSARPRSGPTENGCAIGHVVP